jgi:allophanate hydrolase
VGRHHGAGLPAVRAARQRAGKARHDAARGAAIAVEVWSLPPEGFGRFVAAVPAPLCIGTVELASGRAVHGFLCEPWALVRAREITGFGRWVAYRSSLESGA